MKDLALRRQLLQAQAAMQRRTAAEATAGIARGLTSVERAAGVVRYLGRKPIVIAIGAMVAALLITRPRQAVAWLGYAVTAYATFRRLQRIFSQPGTR